MSQAPFKKLERGYCTICRVMKFHVTKGVCAQCRDKSLAEEDWCEEVVKYATPESSTEIHKRCSALVKAGATGVAVDAREITATWHSKAARKAYEESK